LVSQRADGSFLIVDSMRAWLVSLPFDISFSQDLVLSFHFSEGAL